MSPEEQCDCLPCGTATGYCIRIPSHRTVQISSEGLWGADGSDTIQWKLKGERYSVNLLGYSLTKLERRALINGNVEGWLTHEQGGSQGVADLQRWTDNVCFGLLKSVGIALIKVV